MNRFTRWLGQYVWLSHAHRARVDWEEWMDRRCGCEVGSQHLVRDHIEAGELPPEQS